MKPVIEVDTLPSPPPTYVVAIPDPTKCNKQALIERKQLTDRHGRIPQEIMQGPNCAV